MQNNLIGKLTITSTVNVGLQKTISVSVERFAVDKGDQILKQWPACSQHFECQDMLQGGAF